MKFKGFDPDGRVRIYFTNMPHWRQEGCTYFVTYRLADSIPMNVLSGWEDDKVQWLLANGISVPDRAKWQEGFTKLDPVQRGAFLKYFNRELNTYLDQGRGSCLLRSPDAAAIVLAGWGHFDGTRYDLGDLVVMPNHVHLLVTPRKGFDLEKILQSRKRQSARAINALVGRSGELWQKHSYDHIVRDELELLAFQKYIAENPAKGCVPKGEYAHRSFDW